MGAETSKMVDESVPPATLEKRSIEGIVKYIREKKNCKIVVMTGAGISTSAGIPDFRSPDTGIYANLARLELPYPEAVFDISYFRQNPQPFYALAREMFPGKYRPTITHSFIRLLHDKGLLLKLFTQNIDCLERKAGVPGDMIVEAHGSFATHSCIDCKAAYADELMAKAIAASEIPSCSECKGIVKPDIVFFGEALPPNFFSSRDLPAQADLCIVMGTSLSVQPFAGLPSLCREETPRVLVNLEQAGSLGSRADDVLVLGDCDGGVRRLADALGWLDELEQLWAETCPELATSKTQGPDEDKEALSKDERLHDEVDRLSAEVDSALKASREHETRTKAQLEALQEQENKIQPGQTQDNDEEKQEEKQKASEDQLAASMAALDVSRDEDKLRPVDTE
ncbi:NAD-dependent deacetylase sirtuin-2 [Nannizzia gypsea CBS 118893]|uniref:NAD-dependent protein deacetylase n=1 Tax=Arthroderma gypseum (strain ATCC MYA-4604 / CBS 118893) TaxID=535722 RepID=E4UP46_ARTGP|nr:NAD-dependent deacetylase sirtuin-2 [Nannizzia gypsea CBS 118893]EFQ98988.1 NAD-dependent deacetylase sirtuin-2 [Nannizzia gypsea CBS 118893]